MWCVICVFCMLAEQLQQFKQAVLKHAQAKEELSVSLVHVVKEYSPRRIPVLAAVLIQI